MFDLLFKFLVIGETLHKISFTTYLTHIHSCVFRTLLTFLPYQFWKKIKKNEFIRYGFSLVWFLVLILILAILEQSINNKMMGKI